MMTPLPANAIDEALQDLPEWSYEDDQLTKTFLLKNFRDAMAAPASLKEFQGNVSAVLTEDFWDLELSSLRRRERDINGEIKKRQNEKKLSRDELNKLREELREKAFSKREQKILEVAISNAEYHYLGSGKIMAKIGKGFAEATAQLMVD